MPTLNDYLADKTTYPDSTTITLADGIQTTLGELRGGFMRQSDYTKKTQDLSRDRDGLAREKSDFEQQKTVAESELTNLAGRILSRANQHGGTPQVDEIEAAIDRDPVAKRLREQIAGYDRKLEEIREAAKRVEAANAEQQKLYWTDFYNRQLAALKSKDEALDTDALVKYARDNGYRDLTKAYREMTEDRRMEEAVRKAREDGVRDGIEKAKRDLAQPVIPQRRVVTAAPEGLPTNFDDAADAAKRDPEILSIVTGQSGT